MIHNVIYRRYQRQMTGWASKHYLNLAVFNVVIIILVLLHSARYFYPYWLISNNVIIFISLVLSVLLLGARSKFMFVFSLAFWVFAGLMKIFKIDVWAERIGIYFFESIFLGIILLIFEKREKTNV